jgi:TM2 domain-containing membrane protein YozV
MSDAALMMRYDAHKKSAVVAYLLWWFLGSFGAHRFYLGKTGSAVVLLLITLTSIALMLVLIGFITFMAVPVWLLVDAFLIPGIVRESNLRLANALTLPIGGRVPRS